MRQLLDELHRFYRTYARLLWILAGLLVLSWPGYWSPNSLGQGIASNVFATFLVTPFLLFGIDFTLRDIEQKRRTARIATIRSEMKFLVGRIINSCASGTKTDLIPGLWPKVLADVKSPDAAETVTDRIVVPYLLQNQDVAAAAFRAIDWVTYDEMLGKAFANVAGLRQVLTLSDDAITHEDFARLWKATRELQSMEEARAIYSYAQRERPDFLTSSSGKTLLASYGDDVWELVRGLCDWYSIPR